MTQIGSTAEYYITNRAAPTDYSWWDPAHVPTFYDGGVAIDPVHVLEIDYAAGMVALDAIASGAVTVDVYCFTPEWLGGGFGFSIDPKTDKKEVTTFPQTLNTKTAWKQYIATLMDWTSQIDRHYWYGRAWTIIDCTNDNADLQWTWRKYGAGGNSEQVEYEDGVSLEVARVGHLTTVTIPAGTTAAQIKIHVEADPVLNDLWQLKYPGSQTGAGAVEAKTAQTCSGGRDYSSDIARLGTNILVRHYLDVATGSLEIVSGIGMVEGVPLDVKLDMPIEAPLRIQGIGRLKYHTV